MTFKRIEMEYYWLVTVDNSTHDDHKTSIEYYNTDHNAAIKALLKCAQNDHTRRHKHTDMCAYMRLLSDIEEKDRYFLYKAPGSYISYRILKTTRPNRCEISNIVKFPGTPTTYAGVPCCLCE